MKQYFMIGVLATASAVCQAADFTIQTSSPRQTIRHFGASDAWSMQFIGLWENEAEQQKIADWLFSTKNDAQGKPLGIGLSVWRFNLGAGSVEQGKESQIQPGTRTECFLTKDGTYDWTKQKGQRKFLKMAKERGVPHFLAFLNSAPVYFTQNGLATNTGRGGTINLKDDCYDDFARFMATSMKGIEEHDGIHFDYICPVNEPDGHWNWLGPKQEGSPATNREIARLVREVGKEFKKQKLTTQISVQYTEAMDMVLEICEAMDLPAKGVLDALTTFAGVPGRGEVKRENGRLYILDRNPGISHMSVEFLLSRLEPLGVLKNSVMLIDPVSRKVCDKMDKDLIAGVAAKYGVAMVLLEDGKVLPEYTDGRDTVIHLVKEGYQ